MMCRIGENSPRSVVEAKRMAQIEESARRSVPQKRERGKERAQLMQGSGASNPKRCAPVRAAPMRRATRGRLGVGGRVSESSM
jgi:hypothetical protein